MATEPRIALKHWRDERNGVYLYEALAAVEKDPHLAEVYRRIAAVEARHAATWEAQLQEQGVTLPAYQPDWRTRVLAWAARRFGVNAVLPTIAGREQQDSGKYDRTTGAGRLAADEHSHLRLLRMVSSVRAGGMAGRDVAQFEGRHRAVGGNALRAAVLGANDGLVSNLSLVMGVIGAELNNTAILVTGMAGLLAGAISMALGEWLSVQSSRELYAHQIGIERAELEAAPEEEAEELALIYQARGLLAEQARSLAQSALRDSSTALETLAREELNVDPAELGGSAWVAALTSFVLFAFGAIVPVLPFALFSGTPAVIASLVLSGIGLFVIGSGITLFTGRSVAFSGSRQVLFGLAAALVTFTIGRVIGVSISG
jgi:VIT1/CCC1 family predicted Fe2+/Mn2+ transporter